MDSEKIFDLYNRRARGENPDRMPRPPLELHPARLPEGREIQPREWLYGTQLIRGYVTVLVAPGGTGKSAYAMGVVMSLVANKSFLGDHIFSQVNGVIFNLDDPMDELERRVAALMMHHRIGKQQLAGRLFLEDCDGRGLTMAEIDGDGFTVVYPDEELLIEAIIKHNIGIIVCDPFAESHTLEENSNPMMIKAAAAWRRVARRTRCAVLLVHHVRKGDVASIDSARGAKALTDSARVGLLMSPMSEDEANEFKIPVEQRTQYVRLDDAKRNMAPAACAKWFRLEQIALGNTQINPLYPKGDNVAAITPWLPPDDILDTTPNDRLNDALDAIQNGPRPGVLYTKSKRGDSDRWCGLVLTDMFKASDKGVSKLLTEWFKSGLLYEQTYRHPEWRRNAIGVCVNDTLRPS